VAGKGLSALTGANAPTPETIVQVLAYLQRKAS